MPKKSPPIFNKEKFYTCKEAAYMLGVTSRAIARYCCLGKFDFAVKPFKEWLLPKKDFDKFIAKLNKV